MQILLIQKATTTPQFSFLTTLINYATADLFLQQIILTQPKSNCLYPIFFRRYFGKSILFFFCIFLSQYSVSIVTLLSWTVWDHSGWVLLFIYSVSLFQFRLTAATCRYFCHCCLGWGLSQCNVVLWTKKVWLTAQRWLHIVSAHKCDIRGPGKQTQQCCHCKVSLHSHLVEDIGLTEKQKTQG